MNLWWQIDSKRLCGLVSCILVRPHPSLVPSPPLIWATAAFLVLDPGEKQGEVTSIMGRLLKAYND